MEFQAGEEAELVYQHSSGETVHRVRILGGPNRARQYYVQIAHANGAWGPPFWHWPISALRKLSS